VDIIEKKLEIADKVIKEMNILKWQQQQVMYAEKLLSSGCEFAVQVKNNNGYSFQIEHDTHLLKVLVEYAQKERDLTLERLNALILIAQ
jgi:hypothetical protein